MDGPCAYLVHFERPIGTSGRGTASHYLGSARDLAARIMEHASGRGARLLQVADEQKIGWSVVRTWPCRSERQARELERRMKRAGNHARRCPACAGAAALNRGRY